MRGLTYMIKNNAANRVNKAPIEDNEELLEEAKRK